MACDLGMDKIMLYDLDPTTAKLTPHHPEFLQVPPGSGPRHLAFHPGGGYVYVINEMGNTITTFGYEKQAFYTAQDAITTLPASDKSVKNTTAEIVVHPSGEFLYGSNRGHDSIAMFRIDEAGRLSAIGHEPTQGKNPRNFNISPDGQWLIAANQNGDNLVVFKIDQATGKLTPTGEPVQCFSPVCVKFVQ
jgi:6-phosphogluconolactonase